MEYYKTTTLENTPAAENELFKLAIGELTSIYGIHGIEIGVLNGEKSGFLLSLGNILLYGIDPFIPDSMERSLIGSKEKVLENTKQYADRFTLIEDYSYNVPYRFLDNHVDFIFFDGSHIYEDVKKDYELYYPKICKGGLMFFHDSRMNRGGANFHPGSSKFVDELIDSGLKPIGEAFSLTCFQK